MDRDLRLGVVGAGERGRHHLREAYRIDEQHYFGRNPDESSLRSPQPIYDAHAADSPAWVADVSDLRPSVTAVFDPSATARRKTTALCREHGDEPDTFDALDAFLERGVYDAVIVASPNDRHLEAAVPLLERGVSVLCEKPLAITLEAYDRLEVAVSRSDGVFYPGFNLRSHPAYERLGELLDEGVIGDLGMISCREVRTPFPEGHYYTQAESGGSLLEKNCHDFDLMNWLTDADPVRVCAFGGQHVFTTDTDVSDHAVVIVEYDNGVRATLELCLYAPYGEWHPEFSGRRDYQFRGGEGVLRSATDGDADWELYTRRRRETYETAGVGGGHGGSDARQLRSFLRCVRDDDRPTATVRDAKRAAAVALAATRSIEDGRVVEIDSNADLRHRDR
ncbi:Gfo/Idh/MocA family protein [Natrialbaceae archaeon A-CW3]